MKRRFAVQCIKHGSDSKDWDGKMVLVSEPKTKKQRKEGGCPICKKESLKAKAI